MSLAQLKEAASLKAFGQTLALVTKLGTSEIVAPRRLRWAVLLVVTSVSGFLHFFNLTSPGHVVFDEFHFGKFTSAYCCTRQNVFDVHPPHGKLLIAAAVASTGYDGSFDFGHINKEYGEGLPLVAYRLVPALLGTLLPAVFFMLMLQLGGSLASALLAAVAVTFENALLLESRIIVLDGILVFAEMASLLLAVGAMRRKGFIGSALLFFGSGCAAGLAVGTKFTGLVAVALPCIMLAVQLWRRFSWRLAMTTGRLAVWFLGGFFAVYLAGWALHFKILDKHGPGDAFYRPVGEFFKDTARLHQVMLVKNIKLPNKHTYNSPWWSWPFMARPIHYAGHSLHGQYLIGNPVVWWGATLLLIAAVLNSLLARVSRITLGPQAEQVRPMLWVVAVGYGLAFFGYAPIERGLFIYHYLPPLAFSILFGCLWLDKIGMVNTETTFRQPRAYYATLFLVVLGFLSVATLTFGWEASNYNKIFFKVFSFWR